MAEHATAKLKPAEARRSGPAKVQADPRGELLNRRSEARLAPARELLQRRAAAASGAANALSAAAERPQPNRTGLPDRLKAGLEALSGFSLNDVRVHRSSNRPATLGAHAYAQGADIHLGPGQERHLPHEAWHVVQQKQGRVKPTSDVDGMPLNDDPGLEAEADRMGARAHGAAAAAVQFRPVTPGEVVQRQPVIQRVIDLAGAVQVKPGPPPTLSQGGWFYKVFAHNSKHQAEAIEAEWQAASDAAVPVPSFGVKEVTVGNARRWAFRSKAAQGTFFQFSKGGHTARVVAWVMSQTDKIHVQRLQNVFDHVAAHLGDGQGFYVDGSSNILFIDINTGGTTPGATEASAACAIRAGQL